MIDPKGRLSIPAKFRDALAEKFDGDMNLIVVPNGRCLEVHPLKQWEEIEAKLRQSSMFDAQVREISRLYMSLAKEVVVDAVGRVLLPPDSRQQANLDKEVTLLGGGLRFFEVWDRSRFEDYDRAEQHKLPTLFDKLAGLGV